MATSEQTPSAFVPHDGPDVNPPFRAMHRALAVQHASEFIAELVNAIYLVDEHDGIAQEDYESVIKPLASQLTTMRYICSLTRRSTYDALIAQEWQIDTVSLYTSTQRTLRDVLMACFLINDGIQSVSRELKERYIYTAFMTIVRLRPHVDEMANAFGINTETEVPKEAERLGWTLYDVYALAFEGLSWLTITDPPVEESVEEISTWNYLAPALQRWAHGLLYNCDLPLDYIYMFSTHMEDLVSRHDYQRQTLTRILLVIERELVKLIATPDILLERDLTSLESARKIQARITNITTSYDLNVMATALWLHDDIKAQAAEKLDDSNTYKNDLSATEDVYQLIKNLYLGVGELLHIQADLLDDKTFQEWWPIEPMKHTTKEEELARAKSSILGETDATRPSSSSPDHLLETHPQPDNVPREE